MVTFFASDAIATGTTDRVTIITVAVIGLVGLIVQGGFALWMRRMSSSPADTPSLPSAPPDGKMLAMLMTMQRQVGDLSQAVFEVRDDIMEIKSDAADTKRQLSSLSSRLVEESGWDGKTDRRRINPPPYHGPERRKGT